MAPLTFTSDDPPLRTYRLIAPRPPLQSVAPTHDTTGTADKRCEWLTDTSSGTIRQLEVSYADTEEVVSQSGCLVPASSTRSLECWVCNGHLASELEVRIDTLEEALDLFSPTTAVDSALTAGRVGSGDARLVSICESLSSLIATYRGQKTVGADIPAAAKAALETYIADRRKSGATIKELSFGEDVRDCLLAVEAMAAAVVIGNVSCRR